MRKLLFALATLLTTAPSSADACSCSRPGDPQTELGESSAVFEGTVTSIEGGFVPSANTGLWHEIRQRLGMAPAYADYARKVHFSVRRSWRGVTTTTATVRTGSGGGDCGYHFDPGTSYVVYAYRTDPGLATGICSRTSASAHAAEDFAFLATQPTLALTAPPKSATPFVIAGALALSAAAAIAFLLRKRRGTRASPPGEEKGI